MLVCGCSTLVERAEKAHWTAFQTTDAFLQLERNLDNSGFVNAEMHTAAEAIRDEAPVLFVDSFDLIQTYKTNQTAEGKIKLEGAVEMLKAVTKRAQRYLN